MFQSNRLCQTSSSWKTSKLFFIARIKHVFSVLLQPMIFGAMIHRDEAFDAILSQYTKVVEAKATPPASWAVSVISWCILQCLQWRAGFYSFFHPDEDWRVFVLHRARVRLCWFFIQPYTPSVDGSLNTETEPFFFFKQFLSSLWAAGLLSFYFLKSNNSVTRCRGLFSNNNLWESDDKKPTLNSFNDESWKNDILTQISRRIFLSSVFLYNELIQCWLKIYAVLC